MRADPVLTHLPTPRLLVDRARLTANIARMQAACDRNGVQLWPHTKTHKMLEVARMQLDAGAAGLVCAKIGEAEVMVESGARRLFIAYSLVDPLHGPRLRALSERLDELIVAVTSEAQAQALETLLAAVDLRLPVLMAVDTGQGREGARGIEEAVSLAAFVRRQPHFDLKGLYTHEGHAYGKDRSEIGALTEAVQAYLIAVRDRIDPELTLWPGSSITAAHMASLPEIAVVRPGTYVFGDLWQAEIAQTMAWDDLALTVLGTVVDRPEPSLALLDTGSKTLTSDRTPDGRHGTLLDPNRRAIGITRCSEEHGFATGPDVDGLRVGERVRIVPAHVCPVVNLADEVTVLDENGEAGETWRVTARGKVW